MTITKTNIKKSIFPFIASIITGCHQHNLQMNTGVDAIPGTTKGIDKGFEAVHCSKVQSNTSSKALDNTYIIACPGFTETSDNEIYKQQIKLLVRSLKKDGVHIPEYNCIVSSARDPKEGSIHRFMQCDRHPHLPKRNTPRARPKVP